MKTPLNQKIAILIEYNQFMRNDETLGLTCLSPFVVSSCIMISMYHAHASSKDIDVFALTDTLNKLDLDSNLDFKKLEKAFEKVTLLNIYLGRIISYCTKYKKI